MIVGLPPFYNEN